MGQNLFIHYGRLSPGTGDNNHGHMKRVPAEKISNAGFLDIATCPLRTEDSQEYGHCYGRTSGIVTFSNKYLECNAPSASFQLNSVEQGVTLYENPLQRLDPRKIEMAR